MSERTVCFLIANFDGGGAQKQCILLVNELQRRPGTRVILLYLNRGDHWPRLIQQGLESHHIAHKSNHDPRIIFRVAQIVRGVKADVLISWMHTADSYSFFVRALTWGRVRWVMTERNSFYPGGWRFRLRDKVGSRADAIVSNSLAGDAYWVKRGFGGPRYVVDNIVTPGGVHESGDRAGCVLHIGRLEPQKNAMAVARAFSELATRRPELRFAFVGDGVMRDAVERHVASSGLKDKIAVLGFRSDAQSLLGSARALVTLSSHEGLPNVMLEAVAAGVPVVASDIPEHRELLGDAYSFYVAEANDPRHVADVISAVLDNPDVASVQHDARKRLGAMTPDVVGTEYLRIFTEICTLRPQPRAW